MVIKVADGVTDKSSSRANAATIEAGALRIKWPEDTDYDEPETFSWQLLRTDKWRKQVHYGWRCAAALAARSAWPPILTGKALARPRSQVRSERAGAAPGGESGHRQWRPDAG